MGKLIKFYIFPSICEFYKHLIYILIKPQSEIKRTLLFILQMCPSRGKALSVFKQIPKRLCECPQLSSVVAEQAGRPVLHWNQMLNTPLSACCWTCLCTPRCLFLLCTIRNELCSAQQVDISLVGCTAQVSWVLCK